MRGISLILKCSLYFTLIIISRADSDDSDESDESNEHSKKLYHRITALLDVIDSSHKRKQNDPGIQHQQQQQQQPYPYSYFGYPYYMGTNAVPYTPNSQQPAAAPNFYPAGYPYPPYDYPRPPYPTYQGSPQNYPLLPNAYYPNPSLPPQRYPSEQHKNYQQRNHSAEENYQQPDYSRGYNEPRNGISSVDHTLKSNSEYQEAGHYFGPPRGNP